MKRTTILLLLAGGAAAAAAISPAYSPLSSLRGAGIASAVACIACLGGGVLIALGGWPEILAAAARKGSLALVLACTGACLMALGVA